MSEEKLYTQAEVNEIVEKRMGRVKRKEMRDQNSYKQKYYELLRKTSLIDAGLSFEKAEKYAKYVTGEELDEIERHASDIAADVQDDSKANRGWNPFG